MRRHFSNFRLRLSERYSRFARGIAYALRRTLSEEAMHALRVEMNEGLGYYPLVTLALEDAFEVACSRFGEEQAGKLTPYLAPACDRVASKWEPGEDFGIAVDYALERALEYASQDDILLVEEI